MTSRSSDTVRPTYGLLVHCLSHFNVFRVTTRRFGFSTGMGNMLDGVYLGRKNPLCYKPDHGACNQAVLSRFECLLFYCPHLLFFVLSIILEKSMRLDSAQSLPPAGEATVWPLATSSQRAGAAASPQGLYTVGGIVPVEYQAGLALYG